MYALTKGLPVGYIAVDYVTMTGRYDSYRYVTSNTNVTDKDTWCIDVECREIKDANVGWGSIRTTNKNSAFFTVDVDGKLYLYAALGSVEVQVCPASDFIGFKHTLKITPTTVEVDDSVIISGATLIPYTQTMKWYVNGVYCHSAPRGATSRFYGGWVMRDGALAAHWLPCKRVSDGAYCVFDLVKQEFIDPGKTKLTHD